MVWGWKWRYENVFAVTGQCRDRVRFIKESSKEVTKTHLNVGERTHTAERIERQIAWVAPSEGWVKLNTDGALHGNPGMATAGGVLRDGEGNWCSGFSLNIRFCSAPLAELCRVY